MPGSVRAQCGTTQALTISGDVSTVTSIVPPTDPEVDVAWEVSTNDGIFLELSAQTFDHLQAVESSATVANGVLSLELTFSPVITDSSSAFSLSVGALTFALVALLADRRVALGIAFIGCLAMTNSQTMCQDGRYLVTIHAPVHLHPLVVQSVGQSGMVASTQPVPQSSPVAASSMMATPTPVPTPTPAIMTCDLHACSGQYQLLSNPGAISCTPGQAYS